MQGRKTIKWWKCTGLMIDKYKERLKIKYEELDTEVETVEEEWKKYKDSFVGVAEEMCGRTSGKGGRLENQGLTRWQGRLTKRGKSGRK